MTAITDVTMLKFAGDKLPQFLSLLPKDFVDNIHSTVSQMLVTVLRLLPIFEGKRKHHTLHYTSHVVTLYLLGVPADNLVSLASLFHFEVFKAGDVVIK